MAKKADVIQRSYLQEHWDRLLSRNDVSPVVKAFIRKEKRWLHAALKRAASPGGLGK
jgi:hypothetical protein